MVRVREQSYFSSDGVVDGEAWLAQLPQASALSERSTDRLRTALEVLHEASQTPAIDTRDWPRDPNCEWAGIESAQILAELRVGVDCLIAGLLYRAVREQRLSLDDVEKRFGKKVSNQLRGVLRMAAIADLRNPSDTAVLGEAERQRDNIRKMLVAIVDDVQVALIKLAERTCAIRAVKSDKTRQELVARDVFDVYAPLAHRLGIGHLKWELEDLSFRYLYNDSYKRIARLLDGKRLERDRFITRVTEQLRGVLGGAGIEFEISGRSKHIYSIWRKMQRKGIGFSQVYDIRAIRILVPELKDCYATLGLVHGLWRNIPNEFDDYIASPKENGYRSLHTAVIGPEGKILEVQIRTREMHEEAELGVCAHWRYKGTDTQPGSGSSYDEKINWLRQVLDWHEESGDAVSVEEQLKFNVAQDRVYVFTPRGDVVNLASGATPLDFAYHVHTEVGHRCRGAKVNGQIVPLTHSLQTGDRVEILTGRENRPRRDWLQSGLGYLQTPRARAKVQAWFKSQAREENVDAGRQLLEREFRRLALTSVDYKRIAVRLSVATVDDMYAAVGSGDLSASQVVNAAETLIGSKPQPELRVSRPSSGRKRNAVQVQGVGNLLTNIAGCCKPVPGDGITGFITQGRGVSIHREDCPRVLKISEQNPERVIDVEWGGTPDERFEVDIAIEAYDRQGLLRDVTSMFANARINVLSIQTQTNRKAHAAAMRLTVEVGDLGSLAKLLERLNGLKNVISARRLST
ncbi:GTP diphosphokinase [Congregibacter litoralis]|uniref:GTP pyrophosphokinase n=1 Tax=Congregibacter litoralis KT71 TaxID=314285 RepID=A4A3U1_9GAMM|nr:GTP diphosphokinase [Congregibacter litoralis]EAQ99364.1 (p)ppGpp synthetase, RelA/SpoT family [Congregibacter litoralis KT71]